MKNRNIVRVGVIFFLALLLNTPGLLAQNEVLFDGGLGTQIFPYEISTAAQLEQLAKYVNMGHPMFIDKYYRLSANINLASYGSNFNGGKGWIPIGHSNNYAFKGHLDGNKYTISNLYINNPSSASDGYNNTGLFGRIDGGTIKNLAVTGVNITGNQNVGGIAGLISSYGNNVSEISNCYLTGAVTGKGENVGGIAGRVDFSRIDNCYATGNVTGKNYVGGVSGLTFEGAVRNCAALNESVKATDNNANIGRVSWLVSYFAGSLSNNVAFRDMKKTANDVPVSILNYTNGEDGASISGVELQAIKNYPVGFNSAPWSFTAGYLPGLGGTVAKPAYLIAIPVSLTVNRDGAAWNYHGKTFTLKLSTNESVSFTMTGNHSPVETEVDRSGTWRIYDGDTNTGLTLTTNLVTGSGVLNFFTVFFTVYNSGTVSGSTISATYGGNSINSGTIVIGGKQLVITAVGGTGATNFAYAWSGAGTNNQTTSSITYNLLDRQINAVCTVSGSYAVTFGVVNGNGTLTAKVDDKTIATGALTTYGKDVVFTATPNPGYRVKEWKDNGATVNEINLTYTIANIMEAHHVTVEYEYVTHEVTFDVVNSFGTLTAAVDGKSIPAGSLVQQGKNVIFTANPQYGYQVKEWKLNGAPLSNTSLSYTLQNLSAAATVTVEFEVATYAINFSTVNGNGTLTAKVDGAVIANGAKVQHGKEVVFETLPNANYRIKTWKDNSAVVNGTDATYTISNLTATHNVTVEYEMITYAVSFSVVNGNGSLTAKVGSSNITNGAQVQYGSSVVFTASPNTGYRVKVWKKDNVEVEGVTGTSYTVTGLSAALNVTVEYEQASYTVNFNAVNPLFGSLTATVDGSGIASGTTVLHGKDILFTASPDAGYRVKQWLLNGNVVNGTNIGYALNHTSENIVTVEFELVDYTINFSVENGNGNISATANSTSFTTGTKQLHGGTLVFTATANANYRIKEWKDNGTVVNGTNGSYTIANLSEAHTVTVEFELVTYAVTFEVTGDNGGISATVGGTAITSVAQVQHNSTVVFTAKPNAGYRVKKWTSNGTDVNGTSATYTFTPLTADLTVKVEFEYATFPVNFSVTGGNGGLTATVDGTGITNGVQVAQGKNVVFTTSPSANYRVKEWKLNGTAVNAKNPNYTITGLSAESTVTVEFELVDYVITFSVVTGNGTLTTTSNNTAVSSGTAIQHGSTLLFTATPSNANYHIKEWKDNGTVVNGTNGTYTLTNLAETHSVTVEFVYITYPVTFNVVNGNGGLTATVNSLAITSGAEVQRGSNVLFTATPDAGYRVKEWKLNNTAVTNNTTNNYTLSDLTAASTVTVEFERITYAVNFSVTGGNGGLTATVDGAGITTGALVASGKNVVFTAAPNAGYRVSAWRLGGTVISDNKTNTCTLTALSAISTVTVEFEPDTYAVTFNVTGTVVSGGTLTARVDGSAIITGTQVLRGKSVVFTATPPNNCTRVKEWRLNGSVVTGNTTNSYTLTNLTATSTVTVEFENAPCSVVQFNVVSGNGTIAATVDDVAITTGTSVPNGKSIVFSATPNSGYRVKEWKNGSAVISGNTTNNYTLTNLTSAASVTVEFEALPPTHHLVSFSAVSGNGTLTATVDGTVITSGTSVPVGKTVILTASPATGYHIKEWKNNGTVSNGTNTSLTISNLSASHNVTVEFELNTYEVSFIKINNFGTLTATVEGSSISTDAQVQHGKNVVFTVVPDAGYRVKEWKLGSGTVGDKSNSYTLNNLSAAAKVTVEFELIPYTLTFNVTGGNGTLTAKVDGANVNTGTTVLHGKTVIFTATPTNGYRVKEWKDNTETVNGTATTYTISSYTVAHIVTVTFEPIPCIVTFNTVNSYGSLTAAVDGSAISTGAQVGYGKSVVFTATPAAGYRVKEWKNNNSTVNGTAATYTVNLAAAITVTVEFEPDVYPVMFGVTGGNGTLAATVNGSGISSDAQVQKGRSIEFVASPANGYRVKEWRLNGTTITGNTSNSYTLASLSAAANVTVEFEITTLLLTYSVTGGNGTIAATADGVAIVSNRLVDYGKKVVFTTNPVSGYRVKEWKDNDQTVNGNNGSYTIDNFTVAHHVTVEFEPISYRVTFNVNGGNGRLTATVDGVTITSGTQVPNIKSVVFTAAPNLGYRVKEWIRGGTVVAGNTTNSYTLTGLNAATTVTVEFEIVTHTVTFSEGSNGTLSATVDGSGISSGTQVQEGKDIVFMANPINGYSVKEWKVDGKTEAGYTANDYTLTDLSATTNVTVEFEPTVLMIKFSVEGGNGQLTATVDGASVNPNDEVEYGKSVIFTATPSDVDEYRVKEWKDNGVTVNGGNTTYTINGFAAAHTVVVVFERIPYPVTFHSMNNNYGTLTATINNEPIESGALVLRGSDILFTAIPYNNYQVKGWEVDGETGNGSATTLTINNLTAAHTVVVDFEPITYTVTYKAVDDSNGLLAATVDEISITSGAQVQQGKNIEFLASPNSNYSVKEWKVDGNILPGYTVDRYTQTDLRKAMEVTVEFEPTILMLKFDVEGDNGSLQATVDGAEVFTEDLVGYGKSVLLEASPDPGYRIKEWKDNGATVNGVNLQYTIPNFTTGHTVMVEFEPITYPVAFEVVNGNGTLIAMDDQGSITSVAQVQHSKTVVFKAEPEEGYCVKEWICNGMIVNGNKSNEFEIPTLSEAATVTVEFERAVYQVLFSVVNGNGTLSASVGGILSISSDTLVPHGRIIIFTASPDNDYRVKMWKHNDQEVQGHGSHSYEITLTAAANVTVEFETIPLTITTTGLPDGATGIFYSQMLSVISDLPVSWSIADGHLPEGLELIGDGEISGIPEKAGTFTFTAKVENSRGSDVTQLTLTVERGIGAEVAVPVKQSTTLNSITMKPMTTLTGQTVEFAISGTNNANAESLNWQDALIFDGLTARTTYYVYARSKENDDYLAGAVSVSAAIDTEVSTGSGEDLQETPLTAYVKNGRLYVRGLTEGKPWSVYSASGMLVYRSIATGDMEISLNAQGVFIIQSEDRTLKVSYYGQ